MIHPFLLAVFPILGFYVRNSTEVPLGDLVMPIAVVLLLTLATWLFASFLSGNPRCAGLFTMLCLIPFYTGRLIPRIVDSQLTGLTSLWVRRDVYVPARVSILSVLVVLGLAALGLLARLQSFFDILGHPTGDRAHPHKRAASGSTPTIRHGVSSRSLVPTAAGHLLHHS